VFHSIAKVIERKSAGVSLSRSVAAAVVLARVNSINEGKWEATRFRNGRLTITAPSSIAAQELCWRQSELIKQINQLFDESIITALSFRS
jgi:hypothetical protein